MDYGELNVGHTNADTWFEPYHGTRNTDYTDDTIEMVCDRIEELFKKDGFDTYGIIKRYTNLANDSWEPYSHSTIEKIYNDKNPLKNYKGKGWDSFLYTLDISIFGGVDKIPSQMAKLSKNMNLVLKMLQSFRANGWHSNGIRLTSLDGHDNDLSICLKVLFVSGKHTKLRQFGRREAVGGAKMDRNIKPLTNKEVSRPNNYPFNNY